MNNNDSLLSNISRVGLISSANPCRFFFVSKFKSLSEQMLDSFDLFFLQGNFHRNRLQIHYSFNKIKINAQTRLETCVSRSF